MMAKKQRKGISLQEPLTHQRTRADGTKEPPPVYFGRESKPAHDLEGRRKGVNKSTKGHDSIIRRGGSGKLASKGKEQRSRGGGNLSVKRQAAVAIGKGRREAHATRSRGNRRKAISSCSGKRKLTYNTARKSGNQNYREKGRTNIPRGWLGEDEHSSKEEVDEKERKRLSREQDCERGRSCKKSLKRDLQRVWLPATI